MSLQPLEEICVGSRESPLALAQAHYVMGLIRQAYPDVTLTLKTFKTQGDKFLDAPLSQIGDKGLFVKELEEALLSKEIHLAVHSLKDMLSILPHGLAMHSISHREDPRDALINLKGQSFSGLPAGSVVGTASLRRVAQLSKLRPDLRYETVRGNLQTRFQKLKDGQYDALILAAAGISRMGWLTDDEHKIAVTQFFETSEMLPAVGQGILSVEFHEENESLQAILKSLLDQDTEIAMRAERAFLAQLEGGCRLPVAAFSKRISNTQFQVQGAVYALDGKTTVEDSAHFASDMESAALIGKQLAERLLANGASDVLANCV